MAKVTYFVALPFVATDDGIAAGEPMECFNPVAVVIRADLLAAIGWAPTRRSRCRSARDHAVHPDEESEAPN